MNNERNEMPVFDGHHTGVTQEGGDSHMGCPFPYGQIPFEPKGDLRMTPRLANTSAPRRRCNGELREGNQGSSSKHGWGLSDHPLAMVYSPYQTWRELYNHELALEKGTLFSELDLPLEAINYRKGC